MTRIRIIVGVGIRCAGRGHLQRNRVRESVAIPKNHTHYHRQMVRRAILDGDHDTRLTGALRVHVTSRLT